MKILEDVTPKVIEGLSISIVNKLAEALNGSDTQSTPKLDPNSSFGQDLMNRLSPEDIQNLSSAGVDFSQLSIPETEML